MSISVTPIPRLTAFGTPAFTLGTSNAAGDAVTVVRSNATLLTYDATLPAGVGASSATGSATVSARRDHVHSGGTAATQAEMEAASSTSLMVTPGRQQYHPGMVKMWARVNFDTSPASLLGSYNCASITDNGVGDATITIATDFSNANYAFASTAQTGSAYFGQVDAVATGTIQVKMFNSSAVAADTKMAVVACGDQ
jgi:hypothetical protein